jgi:hypothetical protein
LLDIGRWICLSKPACNDNGSIKRAYAVITTLRNASNRRKNPLGAHLGEYPLWGDPGKLSRQRIFCMLRKDTSRQNSSLVTKFVKFKLPLLAANISTAQATMFAKPRPKKNILPLPHKKRKATSGVEEVNFDFEAREEYLTGFHKRKQQRIKNAQEENAKRARQEKLDMRKQVRHKAIWIDQSQILKLTNMYCLDTRRTKARR